jgi:hypothetical protein
MIKSFVSGDALTGLAAELETELKPLMMQAAEAGAEVLAAAMRRVLGGASSRPGGPPAKLTGELRAAMQGRRARHTKRGIAAAAGVTDPNKREEQRIAIKAAALEYGGTDKKGRVHPPYPFARQAEAASHDAVDAAIARVLETGE